MTSKGTFQVKLNDGLWSPGFPVHTDSDCVPEPLITTFILIQLDQNQDTQDTAPELFGAGFVLN